MFTLEIIMSLFGITLPLELTGTFYDNFFESSWNFFSNLIIEFLEKIQSNILSLNDPWDIIRMIKSYTNPHLSGQNQFFKGQDPSNQNKIKIEKIDWKELITAAQK